MLVVRATTFAVMGSFLWIVVAAAFRFARAKTRPAETTTDE
ncbi:MAG TPA: hypothetical protein VMZ06_00210 [Candidatus Bathyarchaeia archaeon]|nr:hypothetical protein [Candidatus Bathyarchaeia archaeon]